METKTYPAPVYKEAKILEIGENKEKKRVKTLECKILGYEIPFARCKPVREYKKCKSCEGYVLKHKSKKKSKDKKYDAEVIN